MNVDDLAKVTRGQAIGEDLHIARQDNEFGSGPLDEFIKLCFLLCFVFLVHRPEIEWHAEAFDIVAAVHMV